MAAILQFTMTDRGQGFRPIAISPELQRSPHLDALTSLATTVGALARKDATRPQWGYQLLNHDWCVVMRGVETGICPSSGRPGNYISHGLVCPVSLLVWYQSNPICFIQALIRMQSAGQGPFWDADRPAVTVPETESVKDLERLPYERITDPLTELQRQDALFGTPTQVVPALAMAYQSWNGSGNVYILGGSPEPNWSLLACYYATVLATDRPKLPFCSGVTPEQDGLNGCVWVPPTDHVSLRGKHYPAIDLPQQSVVPFSVTFPPSYPAWIAAQIQDGKPTGAFFRWADFLGLSQPDDCDFLTRYLDISAMPPTKRLELLADYLKELAQVLQKRNKLHLFQDMANAWLKELVDRNSREGVKCFADFILSKPGQAIYAPPTRNDESAEHLDEELPEMFTGAFESGRFSVLLQLARILKGDWYALFRTIWGEAQGTFSFPPPEGTALVDFSKLCDTYWKWCRKELRPTPAHTIQFGAWVLRQQGGGNGTSRTVSESKSAWETDVGNALDQATKAGMDSFESSMLYLDRDLLMTYPRLAQSAATVTIKCLKGHSVTSIIDVKAIVELVGHFVAPAMTGKQVDDYWKQLEKYGHNLPLMHRSLWWGLLEQHMLDPEAHRDCHEQFLGAYRELSPEERANQVELPLLDNGDIKPLVALLGSTAAATPATAGANPSDIQIGPSPVEYFRAWRADPIHGPSRWESWCRGLTQLLLDVDPLWEPARELAKAILQEPGLLPELQRDHPAIASDLLRGCAISSIHVPAAALETQLAPIDADLPEPTKRFLSGLLLCQRWAESQQLWSAFPVESIPVTALADESEGKYFLQWLVTTGNQPHHRLLSAQEWLVLLAFLRPLATPRQMEQYLIQPYYDAIVSEDLVGRILFQRALLAAIRKGLPADVERAIERQLGRIAATSQEQVRYLIAHLARTPDNISADVIKWYRQFYRADGAPAGQRGATQKPIAAGSRPVATTPSGGSAPVSPAAPSPQPKAPPSSQDSQTNKTSPSETEGPATPQTDPPKPPSKPKLWWPRKS